MEFNITTDLAAIPKEIRFNYDELHEYVAENIKSYKELVVTEDTIKDGKARKEDLNRLKTALEDARKGIKAQCLAPYMELEAKVKTLTGMVDGAIQSIDQQVKAFDQQRRDDKYKALENFYRVNIGDLDSLLPMEKILNPKWGNVTMTAVQITQEMIGSITSARNDLKIIKAMRSGCEQQMIEKYLETLNMSDALAEKTRFEERQKQLAEYEQRQGEIEQPANMDVSLISQTHLQPAPPSSLPPESLEMIDFRVWVNATQKSRLKQFIVENQLIKNDK